MKAEYRESGKPGYGLLFFSEAMFPEGPWEVAIQRASDRKFLTGNPGNPWINETYFIALPGNGQTDGSLAIEAGPDIVDHLDQQETYRARLRGSGGEPLVAGLRIPAITYSPGGSLDNTPNAREEKPAPEPAPAPTPEPTQEPESARVPDPATPEPEPEPAPERLDMEVSPPEKPASHKYWRWAIIAVLIAGCLAWYFLDPRFKDSPSGQATPAASSPEPGIDEQVRRFFQKPDRAPAEALLLAEKIRPSSPAEQDAVYRLYYYAAEKGDSAALLKYGEFLDPSQPQWGTIHKDAPAAWAAYRKSRNPEKAGQAIAHLREWLEAQAASGNRQAAGWLKEIAQ